MSEVSGRRPYENPRRGELISRCRNPGGAGCADAANSQLLTSADTHRQESRRCPIFCCTLRPACTGSPTERLDYAPPRFRRVNFGHSHVVSSSLIPHAINERFPKSPLKGVNSKLTLCWIHLSRPFIKAGRMVMEGSREGRKDPLVFLLLKS